MPFANLLKSAAGTCRYCGNKAGVLARDHPECLRTFDAGWNRMVERAAEVARSHRFNEESFPVSMSDIARDSCSNWATINEALEEARYGNTERARMSTGSGPHGRRNRNGNLPNNS